MRIRSVKPEFWSHRMHRELPELEALLALALLNYADDEGRFISCAATIRALLFTHRDVSLERIEQALACLEKTGWLVHYEAEVDGGPMRLGVVTNFKRHQVINRPKKSTLPGQKLRRQNGDSRNDHGSVTDESSHDDVTHHDMVHSSVNGCVTPSMEGRKGVERKERKEGVGSGEPSDSVVPGALVPETMEVVHFAERWPGDLATGVPARIPIDYALSWLAWRSERRAGPFPADWKRDLGLRWSSEFLGRLRADIAKKTGGASRESAGPVPELKKL